LVLTVIFGAVSAENLIRQRGWRSAFYLFVSATWAAIVVSIFILGYFEQDKFGWILYIEAILMPAAVAWTLLDALSGEAV
jgi:hypothetical protein